MAASWFDRWLHRKPSSVRRKHNRFIPRLEQLEDRLAPSVDLTLIAPSNSSYGVTNSLVIKYTNTGSTAVPAPLLVVSAPNANANLWLPTDPAVNGTSLQVLATGANGSGTLAPKESGSIVVDFTATGSTAGNINFSVGQITSGQTINWSSLQSSMQPSYMNATAWSAVFSNFTANVGSTDAYQTVLDADATYLAQLGEPTNDVAELVVYEINKADNSFGSSPQGGAVDVAFPTPGLDLTFGRSFQPTVSGRNQTGLYGSALDSRNQIGLLGYGWTSNWDSSAYTDGSGTVGQGNVTIYEAGALRYFSLQTDGTYLPTLGDDGNLTVIGGAYQLTERDGSMTVFNPNGTLNYIQDTNGNRITAGYIGSQMTSLTATGGEKLSLAYNAQGFLSSVTDPSGGTAGYTYSGNYLQKVTTPQGMTQYSYVNNALQTIQYPDGTTLNYTYDSQGRLAGSFYGTATSPLEKVTVGYLSTGGIAYTDANGQTTTIEYNDAGQAAAVTDALGNTTRMTYNPSGNLTAALLPNGASYSYTHDLQGNLLSQTDPLGNITNFTYDTHGNLTGYTDARGNTTQYHYEPTTNNLLSITYANGTTQSYTYFPDGQAQQFVNARGQGISYTYNSNGQLYTENFADGTSFTYQYDSHGNLQYATDAQGRTTTFTYGGDPNNPSNPDLLTKVQYPDGTYLQFSYYVGGQREQSVDQTGFTIKYVYDSAGRLSKLTDGSNNLIVQYTYDPAGNLVQKDMGNGTRTVYTYDAAGNVLSITNLAPNHVTVNSFDQYTYDTVGNVLTDTTQDGQWVYSYDADGQLTQAVFTPNPANPDGLTAQNIQYVYDAAGNRTSQTVNGVTTAYVTNSVNEYTSSTTAGVTTTYGYDLDGNQTAQTTGGSTTTYTFNEISQLTAVSAPGLTASYFYDPLGNRVSQTVNGTTTNFQFDPAGLGNIVAAFSGTGVYSNSSLLAHYTYGLGLTSRVSAAGSAAYYDFNLIGSTVGITNAAGNYVNKYSYLPFGQTTTISTPQLPNPFTFVGQFGVVQDTSNLFAMKSREYAAGTGQFLSNDPLGLAGGDGNVRRYAANSPVNLVDPEGTQASGGTSWLKEVQFGWHPDDLGIMVRRNADYSVDYISPYNGKLYTVHPGEDPVPITTAAGTENIIPGVPPTATYGGAGIGIGNASGQVRHFGGPSEPYGRVLPSYAQSPVTDASKNQITKETVSGQLVKVLVNYLTPQGTAATNSSQPNSPSSGPFESTPTWLRVWTGTPPGGGPVTKYQVYFTLNNSNYGELAPEQIKLSGPDGNGQYTIFVYVRFPEEGNWGTTVIANYQVETPDLESWLVYDGKITVYPVNFSEPAGGKYTHVRVATFTDAGGGGELEAPNNAYNVTISVGGVPQSATTSNVDIEPSSSDGTAYTVYADLDFTAWPARTIRVDVTVQDKFDPYSIGQPSGGNTTDGAVLTAPGQPQYSSSVKAQLLVANASDPPLAIIDTTDPSITSASQVAVSLGQSGDPNAPIPLVTGITLTYLTGGVTQIEVDGVVSAVQPGAGLVASVPLNITLGNEAAMTIPVEVDETASDYTVNPVTVDTVAGQPLRNVQVATLAGLPNGDYSATIDWGDGDTSPGVITALGGGQFIISGSKPHPYAAVGDDTVTVTVNGPGMTPAPAAESTVSFLSTAPMAFTSRSLPTVIPGDPYSQVLTATGGTGGYSYSITAGSLPAWVSLNPFTGVLSGTPGAADLGTRSFTVTATDSHGDTVSQVYDLTVTPSLGGSANAVYVENLYSLLLHRLADAGAVGWVNVLNQGVARSSTIQAIEGSQEYLSNVVTGIYQHYLNRTPDPGGLSYWVSQLQSGWTIEQVIQGFIASPEFYQVQGGGTNSSFVTVFYKDILNRSPDSGGYTYWVNALNTGSVSRAGMAWGFLRSPEYDADLVNSYYQVYLGRPADPGGLAGWVQQLQAGQTDQAVLSTILGSSEAFGLWSYRTYVGNLYNLLLHRPADTGAAGWVNALTQGTAPSSVIQSFEDSQEYRSTLVTGLYQHYLNRAPNSSELGEWVYALQYGVTIEQVIVNIVSSGEFFQVAGGTYSGFVTALYKDILNRPPDPTGYNAWLAALSNGTTSPTDMASAFLTSGEYEADLVSSYYQLYLRRPADAGGLTTWAQAMQNGLSDQQVLAAILGSAEAFADWS